MCLTSITMATCPLDRTLVKVVTRHLRAIAIWKPCQISMKPPLDIIQDISYTQMSRFDIRQHRTLFIFVPRLCPSFHYNFSYPSTIYRPAWDVTPYFSQVYYIPFYFYKPSHRPSLNLLTFLHLRLTFFC